MIVVILNLPPEEIPALVAPLMAVIEARGQAALDEAMAAIANRRPTPEPEKAPAEG